MQESEVIIRTAEPTDNSAGSSLVFAILRSFDIEPDIEGFEADVAALGTKKEPGIFQFVAELRGMIVGVATLDLKEGVNGLLSGIYVDPSIRRRGIGRRLLQHIVDTAKSEGCKKLSLETRERFADAIKLYEANGWTRDKDYPQGYGPECSFILNL